MFDADIENYRPLDRDEWTKAIVLATSGTSIEDATNSLIYTLRTSSATFSIPYSMVALLEAETPKNFEGLDEILAQFAGFISEHADLSNRQTRRAKKLVWKFKEIGVEAASKLDMSQFYWGLVVNSEDMQTFRDSIVGSFRMVYAAFYFAFEDYLLQVGRTLLGSTSDNFNLERIRSKIERDFSQTDVGRCFEECQKLEIARHVRNCIAHRGGKANAVVKAAMRPKTVDGHIALKAHDCRQLYRLVTKKSLVLAQNFALHKRIESSQ